MPYLFKYDDGQGQQFQCNITCTPCGYITASGRACSRNVCIGLPRCWQHTRKEYNVRIKNSSIPGAGKGLFYQDPAYAIGATIDLPAVRNLFKYTGQIITEAQYTQRYGDEDDTPSMLVPYFSPGPGGRDIDAACQRGIASLINHSKSANCRIRPVGQDVMVTTTRKLRNGEELLINYSNTIQFDPRIKYSTKPRRR